MMYVNKNFLDISQPKASQQTKTQWVECWGADAKKNSSIIHHSQFKTSVSFTSA